MCDEVPDPWRVVIQPCGMPNKLVVALKDVSPHGAVRIASPSKNGREMRCYPFGTEDILDLDSLTSALWAQLGPSITKGAFSYDASGQWRPFSATERADIELTLTTGA